MSPNQIIRGSTETSHRQHTAAPLKFRPESTTNLFIEEERLRTFQNWYSTVIKPEELAAEGFYYTGRDDTARCAFCGLEVGCWVAGDTAKEDHKRFSPDCDFVQERPCGNIPRGASSSSSEPSPSSSPPSYDTCGPYGHLIRPYSGPERTCNNLPPTLLEDLEQLGVSKTQGPQKPQYSSLSARLSSFSDWPESCPLRPEALAEAGFYSTKKDDHAICFHCGGGLKDWEATDDPWVEHARWFSRCAFVAMHKGREFIAAAAQGKPAILPFETVNELLHQAKEERREDMAGACAQDVPPAETQSTKFAEPSDSKTCLRDMELCKICYAQERAIVFLPCGHFVSCAMCASALSKCPVCRKPYEGTVRAFLS